MRSHEFPIKKFFRRLFLTNVLLFIIPVILGTLMLQYSSSIIEKYALNSHLSILEQTSSIVEGKLEEIENIAYQIISNPKIQKLRHEDEPLHYTGVWNVLETKKALNYYQLTNNFIFDYFIVYENSELVISPNIAYPLDKFFNEYIKKPGLSGKDLNDYLLTNFNSRAYIYLDNLLVRDIPYDIVTYMRSLPYEINSSGIVAIFLIDALQIEKLLEDIVISDESGVYVLDSNNEVISSNGYLDSNILDEIIHDNNIINELSNIQQKSINGQNILISYTTSKLNGWKYISVMPTHVALKSLDQLRIALFLIIGMMQILGIIFAYRITSSNTKPVKLLINDHNALEEKLKKHLPLLRNSFFDDLLKGEFYNRSEIDMQAKMLDIDIESNFFAVAILRIESKEGIDNKSIMDLKKDQLVIIDLLESVPHTSEIYFHSYDYDKIACLYTHKLESFYNFQTFVSESIERFAIILKNNNYKNIKWYVGGIYDTPLNISFSFTESVKLLDYHHILNSNTSILYHYDIPQNSTLYYFPDDMQKRLVNSTRSGDYENTKLLLNEIFRENIFKRKVSPYMSSMLLNDIWCTLLKLLEQNPFANETFVENIQKIAQEQESKDISDRFDVCLDVYYKTSREFHIHKNSHKISLKEEIVAFIDNNYTNSDLSLILLADKFEMSEVYTSTFFKEQTGENFYSYLQNLRIEEAKKLLEQTNLSIAEISSSVGYSSYNTFSKTFKRMVGMSASDFRILNLDRLDHQDRMR